MANTTLTVAGVSARSKKIVEACGGPSEVGASFKAFTATAGTGNYPVAGLTLDLSGLFKNKVLGVVITGCYDPAVTTGDLMFPAVYVPSATGAPASGKVHLYTSNGAAAAGLLIAPDDSVTITSYVITGFAIGY